MAKFLNGTGVSYHLEQLLRNTADRVILISPYVKVPERIQQILKDLDGRKKDIRLVFRDYELNPAELNWLRAVPGIRTSYCKNLHAKCYVNDKEAIVTSMNLHEFSQINNREMGIYVLKEEEPDLYAEIYNEAMSLVTDSNEVRITVAEVPKASTGVKSKVQSNSGFCIRCHKGIKLNPLVPYCKDCYGVWKKQSDESQAERYCHVCGQPHVSSLSKPSCYDCFKAHKDTLKFPSQGNK